MLKLLGILFLFMTITKFINNLNIFIKWFCLLEIFQEKFINIYEWLQYIMLLIFIRLIKTKISKHCIADMWTYLRY